MWSSFSEVDLSHRGQLLGFDWKKIPMLTHTHTHSLSFTENHFLPLNIDIDKPFETLNVVFEEAPVMKL